MKPEEIPVEPKVTDYGSESLREFARKLLVQRCPECENPVPLSIVDDNGRLACPHCPTAFRPEDLITIALYKAFEAGQENALEHLTASSSN